MAATSDPFFDLPHDSEWNACIGRQGTEENYVDGYIEAAIELASAVIDKGLHGQRDTLAMPILYNTRHGVELALKLAISRLHRMGAIPQVHPKDHDIRSHWEFLAQAGAGDVKLRRLIADLQPYVESLATIDDDGQELRYAENRAGGKSLEGKALANIAVIRDSVIQLGKVIEALKYRAIDLGEERATGTFTPECSRTDLIAIADRLPPIDKWRDPVFDEVKAAVMAEFGLSGKKFSAAVTAIKSSRETCRRIGQMTPLKHLTDAHARYAIEQWALCHPHEPAAGGLGLDYGAPRDFEAIAARHSVDQTVIDAIRRALSLDEIADLEAVYQVGRLNQFAEHYDQILKLACERRHLQGDDLWEAVHYLVTKTNLQTGVARGLVILGRPDLAGQIAAIKRGPA
ncbi:hypothetical protein [Caulobacter sp. S45]|uniref:hypothetical protein n=1 Tax=Caulobacter sp. S45 TaxID=1641861 RepID=UPI00131B6608|nr:hypothetical protein [Caulobacter sp. S45]